MRIGTIAGFELRIHWSTLVIFGLIVWSLAAVQLPDQAPDESDLAYATAGLAGGVAFYLGLLAHEVSHAVVARRNGIGVHGLTLWLLGGIATLQGEARTPGADLRIAVVGPAVSLAIAAVGAGVALLLDATDAPTLVVATVAWLAGINAVLGVFNLIPAAPLDGGRVLRAALWAWRGDRTWAATTAARAGQYFGYALIGVGLLGLLIPGFGGLWFVILGWFLVNAAQAEESQAELQDTLGDVRVSAVMTHDPVTAPAEASAAEILEDYVLRTRHSAFPLRDAGGRLAGLVTLGRLRRVPSNRRAEIRAADVACPMDEVVVASPDDRLVDLLPRLNSCADSRALVVDDGELVGLVTATDVTRAIEVSQLRRALRRDRGPVPRPPGDGDREIRGSGSATARAGSAPPRR